MNIEEACRIDMEVYDHVNGFSEICENRQTLGK